MEQYLEYLRKSRYDRDYNADISVEATLHRHQTILSKFAESRKLNVVKVYKEVVSGESIALRPEIQKLLTDVSSGYYAGVLVMDIDRLSRGNSIDQGIVLQTFQFSNTKIITPTKTYDPNDEADEEFFEFSLFMSRKEYKIINKRLERGRTLSASEGYYMGSRPPYGYSIIKAGVKNANTLRPVPEQARIVQLVYDLYVHQHMGYVTIAYRLNELELKTFSGKQWNARSVSNILNNPIYTGVIRWKYSIQHRTLENGEIVKKRKTSTEYDMYDGKHEAIISKELYAAAEDIRKKSNWTPVGINKNHKNPLAGLLYCGICGQRVERVVDSRNVGRYRCVNRKYCGNSSARQDVVEQAVLDALQKWLTVYTVEIEKDKLPSEVPGLTLLLQSLVEKKTKLTDQLEKAYEFVEQGVYDTQTFLIRSENIKERLKEIADKEKRSQDRLSFLKFNTDKRKDIIPKVERLLSCYDNMGVTQKNQLMKEVLSTVKFKKGKEVMGPPEIDVFPLL